MTKKDYFIANVNKFCKDLGRDNSDALSWEHCYNAFVYARKNKVYDYDYLSLHMAFYLASWGMYRRSSFITKYDYKIHKPVVEEIMKEDYDILFGVDCDGYDDNRNIELLNNLYNKVSDIYYEQRKQLDDYKDVKNNISETLVTKVLLGALGCVPAYDTYFKAGIGKAKFKKRSFSVESIRELTSFYKENKSIFSEKFKNIKIRGSGEHYPHMKILDMGFWQMGKPKKKKSTQHPKRL